MPTRSNDDNAFWRQEDLDGLECFRAGFTDHRYRRHSHAGYVVGVVTHGCEVFWCRGAHHTVEPGDIILVNPQSQHDGEAGCDLGWRYRVLYPTERHLDGLVPRGKGSPAAPRFRQSGVRDPELAGRIAAFHAACEGGAWPTALEETWSEILFDLVDRYAEVPSPASVDAEAPDAIGLARDIIMDEADRPLSLERIAERVGLSRWHLVRRFRSAFGTSPHALLIDRRLRIAKSLLDAGEPIASAAAAACFTDQSHFSRHFFAAFGMTPGTYVRARH